jgi:ABC-type glycerol-3-phosphate transport system permease component
VSLYARSTLIAAFFNTVGTLFGALLGGYALARLLFKGETDLFSFSNQAS